MINRLGSCSKEVWELVRKLVRNFQPRIDDCRNRMEKLRNMVDHNGTHEFIEAQKMYLNLRHKQNTYWKQRAKVFWLKEGGINSNFFHRSVKKRRRNNFIQRLRNFEGRWVEKGSELNNLFVQYFNDIFTSRPWEVDPVLNCIEKKISKT